MSGGKLSDIFVSPVLSLTIAANASASGRSKVIRAHPFDNHPYAPRSSPLPSWITTPNPDAIRYTPTGTLPPI
jgi:hypothetical protein